MLVKHIPSTAARRCKAYTLVELIVVMSVIVLLAGTVDRHVAGLAILDAGDAKCGQDPGHAAHRQAAGDSRRPADRRARWCCRIRSITPAPVSQLMYIQQPMITDRPSRPATASQPSPPCNRRREARRTFDFQQQRRFHRRPNAPNRLSGSGCGAALCTTPALGDYLEIKAAARCTRF